MKKILVFLWIITVLGATTAQGRAIVDIVPNGPGPVPMALNGFAYLSYTIKNGSSSILSRLTIDPGYGAIGRPVAMAVTSNTCQGVFLAPGASCTFVVSMQAMNQETQLWLSPRVCLGASVCSIPIAQNRVNVEVTAKLPDNHFSKPYAATFYPIYNAGTGQWVPPTLPPAAPFNEVSTVFIAFAHAYPQANGAIFAYEQSQPLEPIHLPLLVRTAREENPRIKLLMSLGWGHNDWTYINNDYVNHANIFVPSAITFIRSNNLDGIDIDDESIGESSGSISQANFNGVIANLRNALNEASLQDRRPYYLTITPAGNNQDGGLVHTQVDAQNARSFNLINIQSYFDPEFAETFFVALMAIGYPQNQIANGIDVEKDGCGTDYPPYVGFAGLFNWNMTADRACMPPYVNTAEIADLVGYVS